MATSPNYAWAEPDNSSLVKNGAADIRTLGDAIDTSVWNVGYGQAGKNKILNSNYTIWQRGTTFTNPADNTYTADRVRITHNGTGATRTISRQAFTPGTAPVSGYEGTYFYRYAISAAGTGNTYNYMNTAMEDVQTLAGQPTTISFWAKADAARSVTVTLRQNFGSGGSGDVSISVGTFNITTSWVRYSASVTVTSIAGKTIGTGSYLELQFANPSNTTMTMDYWGAQVEYGSKATPFQTATGTIQGELAACQRYFYDPLAGVTDSNITITPAFMNSTTEFYTSIPLPVQMRVSPSFSVTAASFNLGYPSAVALSTLVISGAGSKNMAAFTGTIGTALTANKTYYLYRPGTSATFQLSAEL